jgi:ABC-2 type transport system ATP-binding protein
MNIAISIDQVRKHYGDLCALNGVSFEVPEGVFFGLLGPNGAGKSTLINIMAGLTRATSGHVRILGHDVVTAYRQSRQLLGVVPQELVYDPFFTVMEVLRLQSGYFGFGRENEAWIGELLETLSLSDKADANLMGLSGGMKRRVLIAQALVHQPKVVVLDEPTAGVDVELRQALWQFTQRLHRKGHTIVLTTHYLEEAEALCDDIAILRQGEVVARDSKQGLLQRLPYRMLRLSVDNSDKSLPPALESLLLDRSQGQLNFRLHKTRDSVAAILSALQQAGINVVDLATEDMGLEEVFLDLTTHKIADTART